MAADRVSHEPFLVRILLVLGGQTVFATLTDVLTGTPPALEATVGFGLVLASGLGLQSRGVARRVRPRRWDVPR